MPDKLLEKVAKKPPKKPAKKTAKKAAKKPAKKPLRKPRKPQNTAGEKTLGWSVSDEEEGEKKGDIEEEKEDQLLAEALAKSRKERAEDADIFDFNF